MVHCNITKKGMAAQDDYKLFLWARCAALVDCYHFSKLHIAIRKERKTPVVVHHCIKKRQWHPRMIWIFTLSHFIVIFLIFSNCTSPLESKEKTPMAVHHRIVKLQQPRMMLNFFTLRWACSPSWLLSFLYFLSCTWPPPWMIKNF